MAFSYFKCQLQLLENRTLEAKNSRRPAKFVTAEAVSLSLHFREQAVIAAGIVVYGSLGSDQFTTHTTGKGKHSQTNPDSLVAPEVEWFWNILQGQHWWLTN